MYLHVIYGQLLLTCDITQHTRAHLIHINIQLQDLHVLRLHAIQLFVTINVVSGHAFGSILFL